MKIGQLNTYFRFLSQSDHILHIPWPNVANNKIDKSMFQQKYVGSALGSKLPKWTTSFQTSAPWYTRSSWAETKAYFANLNSQLTLIVMSRTILLPRYKITVLLICDPPSKNQPCLYLAVFWEIPFWNIQLQNTELSFVLCLCVEQ